MALDYQTKVYWPIRTDKRRTTYALMNQWFHVKPFLHNICTGGTNDRIPSPNLPSKNLAYCDEERLCGYSPILNKTTYLQDADIPTQREMYNRKVKLHLRYINHPGKIAQLGLTTRPVIVKMESSTDGQPHLQYYKSGGYDDFHKAYLAVDAKEQSSNTNLPPRCRQGRCGSTWRHIKEPMQAHGSRTLYIDGGPKIEDMNKVIYKTGHQVNLIQKSERNVKPIHLPARVRTPDALKIKMADPCHGPDGPKGREYGHWHIIR